MATVMEQQVLKQKFRAAKAYRVMWARVVIAMIRNPCAGCAGAVETGEENQNLFDYRIELNRAVSQSAMIANGCSESAQ